MSLAVYLGWDSREPLAFAVAAHSIVRRASGPVTIIPLVRGHFHDIYTRPPIGTTEFALTRFLCPHLSGFEGFSIFMDSDVLVQCDVYELLTMAESSDNAVWCVQHDYEPTLGPKATGIQTAYPRKNWSSVMVFNNACCGLLTPYYVNTATPADLHRFKWTSDDAIGALPLTYNWLVGEYEPNPDAKILHYTLGSPCFKEYEHCDQSDLWWAEYTHMNMPHVPLIPYERYAVARAAGYPVPPMMDTL